MRRLVLTTALAALVAACGGTEGQAQSGAAGAPVASKPANAPDQQPAFAGQTRAPEVKSNLDLQVTTLAEGLDMPWGLAFLPDGRLLITEKHLGQLQILGTDGKLSGPIIGLPAVVGADQGGLLGVAVDPKFAGNGLIYWSYAEPAADGTNNTAVARGGSAAFTVAATGSPAPTLALGGGTATGGVGFEPSTGVLRYAPPEADVGTQTFTFTKKQ